jgi:Dolichyl-phosphate-mannose-protein mannosyltransferase
VILIVVAFVVPRLALLAAARGVPLDDSNWYFFRALSIAHGNGYAFDGTPTAFWPVGYPGFLALLFLVFPAAPITALIANFALSGLTLICSFGIFLKLKIPVSLALFGVMTLAIFPNFIFYQNLLLSEILMMTMLSVALLSILSARSSCHFLLSGVAFGFTALVKSQILLLPIFLLLYDVWQSRKLISTIQKYLLVFIGMLVVIFPWTLRNYMIFDRFILVQSDGGYQLLMGNNEANPWGGSVGKASELVATFPGVVADIEQRLTDEMNMNDRAAATAFHFMTANPVEVLRRVPYKLYRFFRHDPQGIGELLRSNAAVGNRVLWLSSLFQLSLWYHTIILGLAISSAIVFVIGPIRTRAHFVLLSTIFYSALISAVFFGEGRFHIPILPEFVGCMLVTLQAMQAKLRHYFNLRRSPGLVLRKEQRQ